MNLYIAAIAGFIFGAFFIVFIIKGYMLALGRIIYSARIEIFPGSEILDAAMQARLLSCICNARIEFEFNGVELEAHRTITSKEMVASFHKLIREKRNGS